MCLGANFTPGHKQKLYELHGFRRVGIYAFLQILISLFGLAVIIIGNQLPGLEDTSFPALAGIGVAIIIFINIIFCGKPFFLHLHRMGRVSLLLDKNKREVYLVTTRFGGLRTSQKLVCSNSQFRGIAYHAKTNRMLLLCRKAREESLLLPRVGEVLPKGKSSHDAVLEEIGLVWFQRHNEGFFGTTTVDFSEGIVDKDGIVCPLAYDYYLKRSDTWKPKPQNDVLAKENRKGDAYKQRLEDMGRYKSVEVGGAVADVMSPDAELEMGQKTVSDIV